MVRIISENDFIKMPWKNGKGETTQIYIFPEGTSVANNDFFFRLSSAPILSSGEFSQFSGMKRILFPVEGNGFYLNNKVYKNFEIARFSGDEKTFCELVEGPVRDLGIVYDPRRVLVDVELFFQSEKQRRSDNTERKESLIVVSKESLKTFNALFNGSHFLMAIHLTLI